MFSPKLALVFRVKWDDDLGKISNYENIKHRKVRSRGADTVGRRNQCIRRRAEGRASGGTAASCPPSCVRLGDGIEDPAEGGN
jgi:hypothetical protein